MLVNYKNIKLNREPQFLIKRQEVSAHDKLFYHNRFDLTFHKYGFGARKIYGDQDIRVSRGGKNTKIYAIINEKCNCFLLILMAVNFLTVELLLVGLLLIQV